MKTFNTHRTLSFLILLTVLLAPAVGTCVPDELKLEPEELSQYQDLVDSFEKESDRQAETGQSEGTVDVPQSFDQLMADAQTLTLQRRMIDARAKYQKALQLRPTDYRPHMALGQYYLFDVSHFKLAYRYIVTAEELFLKQYADQDGFVDPSQTRDHVMLLYLKAEAELNLDKYADSLKTLENFEKRYFTDWYPGAKAWVLMKLKRVDEAIAVAQSALLQEKDRRRIYNVLGILLSIRGQRELSIRSFQQAIAQEVALGSIGQVATPLNNAGEVYREMFRDSLAEASWLRAVRMPDGCEHILPSLNLATLYIDEGRFRLAERALSEFQACFAQQVERQDTEHRGLLALARGKINLHIGKVDEALAQLAAALDRQQWFGKIGTNENDVRFAALISSAQAMQAKVATIKDRAYETIKDKILAYSSIPGLRVKAWWLNRQARELGMSELDDFEDLSIRNTDTMIEYPTVGSVFEGFPTVSMKKRIERMISTDDRPESHSYYKLYLAQNLLAHSSAREALSLLTEVANKFRENDRLARAQHLVLLIKAKHASQSWFKGLTAADADEEQQNLTELFNTLPSMLRFSELSLPVTTAYTTQTDEERHLAESLRKSLSTRLSDPSSKATNSPTFQLQLSVKAGVRGHKVVLSLVDTRSNSMHQTHSGSIGGNTSDEIKKERAEIINVFLDKVFSHKVDPAGAPVPRLELLEGLM